MADNLALIKRIIDEHKAIGGHIKLVGESVADEEALATLERARADWVPGRPGGVSEKRNKLQQAMSFLDAGLKKHFAFEEKVLPPLLGDLLMRGLLLQHQEIRKEIDEAKSIVTDVQLEGLNREELLAGEARTQQRIGVMCQLIEEHAAKEEVILEMVQGALEEKG